jgi:hypothetical protein
VSTVRHGRIVGRVKLSLVLAFLAAAVLAGCSIPPADPIVDRWPIGPELNPEGSRRAELLAVAQAGLDLRDPGHPAISSVTLHSIGSIVRKDGTVTYISSSVSTTVVRFVLADGSIAAIGVRAFLNDPLRSSDYGPAPQRASSD